MVFGKYVLDKGMSGPAVMVVCAALYLLAFALHQLFFSSARAYAGVYFVFLPAGVKLFSILIGRLWGAAGVAIANFLTFFTYMHGVGAFQLLLLAVVWIIVPYLAIVGLLAAFKVPANLQGIRFWHLLVIDLLVSSVNAMAYNGVLLALGVRNPLNYWNSVITMAIGDFFGTGLVMLLLLLVVALLKWGLRREGN